MMPTVDMRNLQKIIPLVLATILFAGLLVGCSAESRKNRHTKRADNYFASGQYAEAEIEYLNVLKLGGPNTHAIRQLGMIYFENGRTVRALAFLTKGTESTPDDTEARLKIATIYLTGGDPRKAREIAGAALDKNPKNETAILILAQSVRTSEDVKQVRLRLQKLVEQNGDTAPLSTGLGMLLANEGKLKEAEAALKHALSLDPKFSAAHQALGVLAWAQKDIATATAELKAATDHVPQRSAMRLQYADFLVKTGNTEEAKRVLTALTKTVPDYLPPWTALGEIALAQKDFKQCESLVKNALARDPDLYETMLLNARLKLATGETEKAIGELERLISIYARSAPAHYFLGNAYLLKNDLSRALGQFNEAVALNPELDDAVLLQAQLNIRRDNIPFAIESLNRLLKRRPNLAPAYFLLANAYNTKGNADEALATFRRMAERFPKDPQAPLLTGTVLMQQGKPAEARKAFEKALEIEPNFRSALEQLVNLDVSEKKFPDAFQRIQKQLDKTPDAPELLGLLGKVYMAQDDTAQAERAFLQAVKLKPDYVPGYRCLAQIYINTGKHQQAMEKLEKILAGNPTDALALIQLAIIHNENKNYPAARDAYEKLLAANPRASVALNNLAYLYSEHLGQLDKAYDAARKARELLPNDPSMADTLGWILYKRGEYSWALSLLQESAEKLPGESEVLYHLGMTHYMLGQEQSAKSALQRALQAGKDFNGKDEASRRLAILNINLATADPKVIATLEKTLTEHPNDPVVLSRLASIYERDKAVEKAVGLYERVLAQNPKNLTATIRLAELCSGHLHDSSKAMKLAKAARNLAPDDPEIAHTLGRLAYESGDFAWSLALLQESQRKLPNDAGVLYDLALAYCSVGNLQDAASSMRSAVESTSNFPQADAAKQFLSTISLSLSPETAQQSSARVQEILKKNPLDLLALAANGLIQEQRGDFSAAKQTCESILSRYPLFTPANKRLALLYAQPGGDPQKAYDHALKARTAFPNDAEVAKTLGIISFTRGDYARAVQLLKESSAKRKQDADVFFHLGLAHHQLKQKKEAQEALRHALTLNLDAKSAQEANRILAN